MNVKQQEFQMMNAEWWIKGRSKRSQSFQWCLNHPFSCLQVSYLSLFAVCWQAPMKLEWNSWSSSTVWLLYEQVCHDIWWWRHFFEYYTAPLVAWILLAILLHQVLNMHLLSTALTKSLLVTIPSVTLRFWHVWRPSKHFLTSSYVATILRTTHRVSKGAVI